MKHLLYQLCTISLLLAFSTGVFAQTTPQQRHKKVLKGTTSLPFGYYEYLPSNYSSASKLPVVIFFHGIKESGNGTTDLSYVLRQGPPKMVNAGKDFPFILISPQHPGGFWSAAQIDVLIDFIVAKYKVDPYRVYVTGLSAGGSSAWTAGQTAADKVGGLAPMCGSGNANLAYNMKNMGVWAFHNDKDGVMPVSSTTNMVNAINKAGGHAKMTIYSGYSHDCWTRTYNDQNFWDWLLAQRRGTAPTTTTNKLPVVSAGVDKTITLPTNSISITSTATDSDGSISSRVWTKVSGPSAALSNTTSATLQVASMVEGTYVFRITAKDNSGASAYDDVKVIVNSTTTTSTTLTVNAGVDRVITLPTNTLTLSAATTCTSGSVSYTLWKKVSGPTATMTNYSQKTMYLSNLLAGTYVFGITVKSTAGKTVYDEVKVTVNTATTSPITTPPSGEIIVNTGADRTITLPTNKATMTATISGNEGSITYTLWTKVSGPSATMTNYSQKTMYLSNLVAGTYVFRLTVKDNLKATGYDEVKVIVKSSTARFADLETSSPEIKLYPNPTVDKFKLELNNQEETTAQILVVSSKDGMIVRNEKVALSANNTPEINVANLASGVYFVKVITNGNEKVLRFVKE